jgi:hypothetical protein
MAQPTFTIDVEYGLAVRRGTRLRACASVWASVGVCVFVRVRV